MASTYLQKTGITGSSETTWTISCWVKYTGTSESSIYSAINGSNFSEAYFYTDNTLEWYSYSGGPVYVGRIRTNRVFRDKNAWYHLTFVWDSNNGTASDRMRLYVNGIRETSFSLETQPSSGASGYINGTFNVGSFRDQTASYMFNGLMTHYHFIDGTAYDASAFGETDATTGIWKPKTAPSVTYGTNGFFLKFENSGSMGTDSSGNANNFTVNGTPTQTVDTPSNVFCVVNAINKASEGSGTGTLSNGNLTVTSAGTSQNVGTLASSIDTNSKWYYEFKVVSGVSGTIDSSVGWSTNISAFRSGSWATLNSLFLYASNGQIYSTSGWTSAGTAPTYTNGDIIGCTVDLENNQIKWYKNGTLAYTISSISFVGDVITPHSQWSETGAVGSFNFGNGYFGTTAVASGNADDNGLGIFEYAPPTGYLALCTKNINEQEYS